MEEVAQIDTQDPRTHATRKAILDAFRLRLFHVPYSKLTALQIAREAGVGRSTFYEHFSGKDAVLAASVSGPFALLADCILTRDNTEQLVPLMEHFWHNRSLGRAVLTGATRRRVTGVLADLIEQRLGTDACGLTAPLLLPPRLVAKQLAEGLLGPLHAWLVEDLRCSSRQLATASRRMARGSLLSLAGGWT